MRRLLILSAVAMFFISGLSAQNLHNGHEYVDLGLSVKWATCNVGADTPEDYGDYYAWGETTTKDTYYASNCTTWKQDVGDIAGVPQYDAATARWGGDWRMPTLEEFNELLNNCTWKWTTREGFKGYEVISNVNGNAIFMPAAGYCVEEGRIDGRGVRGMYWASTHAAEGTQYAYNFYFDSGYQCAYWISRADGHSVRPVLNIDGGDKSNGREDSGVENSNDDTTKRGSVTKRTDEELVDGGSVNDAPTKAESTKNSSVQKVTNATYNGHKYVDLGLSVKWATCNVGADRPEDYGDYYAWGDTETKDSYPRGNCETNHMNLGDIKGTDRDVAHVKWGGNWRMPTVDEFDELLNKCTWTWTTQNGKSGYKVTSRVNGNSIFLPAAGYRDGDSLGYDGSSGHYWSSMPYQDYTMFALILFFESGDNYVAGGRGYRSNGRSVRPVLN